MCLLLDASTESAEQSWIDFLNEGSGVYHCDKYPLILKKDNLFFHECDISDYNQVKNLSEMFTDKSITFNSIINNARINLNTSIEDITLEQWDKVMKTNVYGTFYVTKLFYIPF